MTTAAAITRPTIALAMGDPAGISAELAAKVLSLAEVRAAAKIVVFGDRRVFEQGAKVAGLSLAALDLSFVAPGELYDARERPVFIDLGNLAPETIRRGEASPAGGAFALENFRRALLMAKDGKADAVCFTPFNKKAMRYVYPAYDDEIRFICEVIGFAGHTREFNVLETLWNARVTSHIPLSEVAAALSTEGIVKELALTDRSLRKAGFANPRIAVAAVNPHGGDGGNFGQDEIEIIEPAVKMAIEQGFNASGPYPADTVFVRARRGDFDAVLTMYHDQGQIAMKLMGFDKGVTMMGGLPFPVCTPAHGTAYDIAGQGIANVGATREALLLAARMAARNLAEKN